MHRRCEQVLHRAALDLARHRQRRHHDHRHRQDHAHQPRHDVVLGDAFGVVAAVHAPLERRAAAGRGHGAGEVVAQRAGRELDHCGDRVAGGRRVGRIGFEQHRRPLAAQHPALEAGGDREDELDVAALDHPLGVGGARIGLDDLEVAGVLERTHEAARERPLLLCDHRGRQAARVAVDRKAEQGHLDDRDADHHREGQAVAFELDQLLDHHREQAAEAEALVHANHATWVCHITRSCRPPAGHGG